MKYYKVRYNNEVHYCGKCRKSQESGKNIKCKVCNERIVSWYTNGEGITDAHKKWEQMNVWHT